MVSNSNDNIDKSVLPIIPLSPIVQSYIICTNALNLASDKLVEAKKANPPVQVGVLRSLIETSKVESHRLASLTQKMQSVEAATAIFWDSDELARQIAVIDSQLFQKVFLDKRSLSQLDKDQSKLCHLLDFYHYLSHSFAHQLIYWGELLNNPDAAAVVVPPVNPNKDSLVSHLVRVAYLLLHAYRDFSGFAAIMRALTFPEVTRLNKKLWQNCNTRTKDIFRDLVQIISPSKNYQTYHTTIRTKLELHINKLHLHLHQKDGAMIAIPWIQPHLLSVRSIIAAYTAGDNDNHLYSGGDIVLSTPGANRLDMEISILELCQHHTFSSDFSLEEILTANGLYDIKSPLHKRLSIAIHPTKAIHIEGLRSAVMPVANLKHLPPGEQLIHHWLVSRAYLRKDQLINESIEVEPLKSGERITCDADEFEENITNARYIASTLSTATSKRTSFIPESVKEHTPVEQELVNITPPKQDDISDVDSSSSSSNGGEQPTSEDTLLIEINDHHEVTPQIKHELLTETEIIEMKNESDSDQKELNIVHKEEEIKTTEPVEQVKDDNAVIPIKEPTVAPLSIQSISTNDSKIKSRLSPSAPEFIPTGQFVVYNNKPKSISTITTDEKWLGYPVHEDDEVATLSTNLGSEKWLGYPVPDNLDEDEDEDEVWRGYPGPATDSPRRASSQSEASEEWKGYQATKMEECWQQESALKVHEHEWQGYTLETLDEDELDSSTMMNGQFEKSRRARRQTDQMLQFQKNRQL